MSRLIYNKKVPCGHFEVYDDKPQFKFAHCQQIHSTTIIPLEKCQGLPQGDGLVIQGQAVQPMGVVTADCLPIVLCSSQGAALIHAGWRGLADGILQNPQLKEMAPEYAFIGPHISQDNYEVSAEFIDNFPQSEHAFKKTKEKLFFSLEIEAQTQIMKLYGPIPIESSNICTYNHSDFHSYRKDQTNKRNWNILKTEKR